jgi:hypothetical protein
MAVIVATTSVKIGPYPRVGRVQCDATKHQGATKRMVHIMACCMSLSCLSTTRSGVSIGIVPEVAPSCIIGPTLWRTERGSSGVLTSLT